MLKTKNLTKTYKPKKGVPVKAVDNISLTFPEKGMIFLLGKSGSGKSTLLNLLGGLDSYDGGEIVIKGVSSKDFRQSHFDSYRNTYVGFIFQEYNVLDEFTVGANIALAIELQGKKADDDEINRILTDVDLDGYGDRKPGELSGGQKQRVAIARALVKNPDIIMADEPTGALDSATGAQVLDTLKKLSREKLVIVVSHDREFATKYADRIIELSDGHVISDVTRTETAENAAAEESGLKFSGNTVSVSRGYHLSEDDRIRINEYIESIENGVTLELEKSEENAAEFVPTDCVPADGEKKSGSEAFSLIKSKLPMKCAFKIGAGGLRHKKFRLVITILLSCIAFGLFGLSDTFGSYNHITACTDSIIDTGINYASFVKNVKKGEGNEAHRVSNAMLSDSDMSLIKERCGVDSVGVYKPNTSLDFSMNTDGAAVMADSQSEFYINPTGFTGFAEIDNKVLGDMGAKLICGALPEGGKNEIAVSEYIYETFKLGGYIDADGKKTDIARPNDLIGKEIKLGDTAYTVTAVVDTGEDTDRYTMLKENPAGDSSATQLVKYALYNEFRTMLSYSLTGTAMVGDGTISAMTEGQTPAAMITDGWIYFYCNVSDTDSYWIDATYMTTLDRVSKDSIVWFDGEKSALSDKELIVTEDLLNELEIEPESVKGKSFDCQYSVWSGDYYESRNDTGYKVVGYYKNTEKAGDIKAALICASSMLDSFTTGTDGVYSFAVGAMPEERDGVRTVVDMCVNGDETIGFELENSVTFELDTVNTVLKSLSKVFFWIGVGFAVFAAVMLANFIATSISYKKQEIGILRAIGSRGADVFRIFFSESLIIAGINFVLSCLGVAVATAVINNVIRTELNVLITVLHFGVRQAGLLLILSLAIAALASFFPVKRIASKKPIDAIRNR